MNTESPTIKGAGYVDVEGIRTFYIDRGTGPAIMLMHGASVAFDANLTWFRNIDHLARSHRVVAFDQIGFGRTGMPPEGKYRNRHR